MVGKEYGLIYIIRHLLCNAIAVEGDTNADSVTQSLQSQQVEPSYKELIFTYIISYFVFLPELWCQSTLVRKPSARHPCVYKI